MRSDVFKSAVAFVVKELIGLTLRWIGEVARANEVEIEESIVVEIEEGRAAADAFGQVVVRTVVVGVPREVHAGGGSHVLDPRQTGL